MPGDSESTLPGPSSATSQDDPLDSPFHNCSICRSNTEGGDSEILVTLPCRHTFHEECILLWLDVPDSSYDCPYCRTKLTYRQCGDPLPYSLFRPGADLAEVAPSCKACEVMYEMERLQPLITKLWCTMYLAYPEQLGWEFSLEPPSPEGGYWSRTRKEEFRRACIVLRNWSFARRDRVVEGLTEAVWFGDDDHYDFDPRCWKYLHTVLDMLEAALECMFPTEKDLSISEIGIPAREFVRMPEWTDPVSRYGDVRLLRSVLRLLMAVLNWEEKTTEAMKDLAFVDFSEI